MIEDNCRRFTTSAHELFHRVEYSYGYITGTPGQTWWVEALGSWSQKYAYPDQHDYVSRVSLGLQNPAKPLLQRSYDACHFWKHFGEFLLPRVTGFSEEFHAIEAFMDEFSGNGNDAKAACATIWSLQQDFSPFNSLYTGWARTNFSKDLDGTIDTYNDNAVTITNCGRDYGPYPRVPLSTSQSVSNNNNNDATIVVDREVGSYSTEYHEFQLASSVTHVSVRFRGNIESTDGLFAVTIQKAMGDEWDGSTSRFNTTDWSWEGDVEGNFDRVIVAVSGLDHAGDFVIAINESDSAFAALVSSSSNETVQS